MIKNLYKKWLKRIAVIILVLWLLWLTVMQIYLNNQVEPFSQSDMLKALVGYQEQIDYLEEQIQALEQGKTPPAPLK